MANDVKLWSAATGRELADFKGHTDEVRALAFSPDAETLATGGQDNTIKLWDVATGKETATFRGHADAVYSVVFSADGKTLASGSADKSIKLWDVPKRQTREPKR
jgi:WD40 repeat protein